jgi:site-specific recombinase XerD
MEAIEIYSETAQLETVNPLDQFLAGKMSGKTKKAYQTDIKLLCEFASLTTPQIARLSGGQAYLLAEQYRVHISKLNNEGYLTNPATVARKISTIKTFFEYLAKLGFYNSNPLDGFKSVSVPQESTSNGLSIIELKTVFEQIPGTTQGKRDRAILDLLFFAAMRRAEVASLRIGDITKDGEYDVIKFIGKRNKFRSIPLKPAILTDLKEYIQATGRTMDDKSAPLFISLSNTAKHNIDSANYHIDSQSIWNIVKKYRKLAKITKNITPHSFRHTAVTVALDNGCSYRDVMNLTGHSNPRMVARYDRGDKLKNNAAWKLSIN